MSDTNQGTYRILVVEDEESLAEGIAENLQLEGYETEIAPDGLHAMERIRAGTWDLILLDVMLPGMDGYTICQTARSEGIEIPVLFLTAKGSTGDRIRGLEAGGDDYLSKPFALKELLLRVAAILRRKSWYLKPEDAAGATLSFGGNTIDFKTYQGKAWDGSEQHLTHKEALILKCLADRTGQIVSREEILEATRSFPPHALSTILSCGCASASSASPRLHDTSTPSVVWATDSLAPPRTTRREPKTIP